MGTRLKLTGRDQVGSIAFTSRTKNPDFAEVFDISPQEVAAEVAANAEALAIIDVREPSEFVGELGHIRTSKLVVLDSLPDQIATLPKDKPIVFVCRSGGRSARASAFALSQGFDQVYNMRGGMLLWNSAALPVER